MDYKPGSEGHILLFFNSSQGGEVHGLRVGRTIWQFKTMPIELNLMLKNFTRTKLTSIKAIVLAYLSDFIVVTNSGEECINQSHLHLKTFP